MLAPKFFHGKANEHFVGKLKLVRRIDLKPQIFSEIINIGTALYLYKLESLTHVHIIYHDNLDWPFSDKHSKKEGYLLEAFEFFEVMGTLKNWLIVA